MRKTWGCEQLQAGLLEVQIQGLLASNCHCRGCLEFMHSFDNYY